MYPEPVETPSGGRGGNPSLWVVLSCREEPGVPLGEGVKLCWAPLAPVPGSSGEFGCSAGETEAEATSSRRGPA